MSDAPKTVFISHGQPEKRLAQRICKAFEEGGLACWIAPRDVQAGGTWAGSIIAGIKECKVMVLVLSQDSNQSQHVAREVSQAIDDGDPIFVYHAEEVELSADLKYYLSTHQYIEVDARVGSEKENLERLFTAVKTQLKTGRAQVPPPPRARRGGVWKVAGTVLLLGGGGYAGWTWWSNSHNDAMSPGVAASERSNLSERLESASVRPTILVEVNDSPDPVQVGGWVSDRIRVWNQGQAPVPGVSVHVEVPEGLEWQRPSGTITHTQSRTGELIFNPVLLHEGSSVDFGFVVVARTPGEKNFKVRVHAEGLPRPIEERETTHIIP